MSDFFALGSFSSFGYSITLCVCVCILLNMISVHGFDLLVICDFERLEYV